MREGNRMRREAARGSSTAAGRPALLSRTDGPWTWHAIHAIHAIHAAIPVSPSRAGCPRDLAQRWAVLALAAQGDPAAHRPAGHSWGHCWAPRVHPMATRAWSNPNFHPCHVAAATPGSGLRLGSREQTLTN